MSARPPMDSAEMPTEGWDDFEQSPSPDDHAHYTRWREPDPHLPLGYRDDIPVEHDPLDPHPEVPTPIEMVVRLTRQEREKRVERLVEMAHESYREALAVEGAGKEIVGVCSLVSGGNDSYTVAHLFRNEITHLVHANTETGIEATRGHVRQVAREWGVPLIEHTPPEGQGYFDLVLGNVWAWSRRDQDWRRPYPGGFPGPAAHAVMQQRIKGRALALVPHDFGISGSTTKRVVFIAGRRRSESRRRAKVPHYESKGTILWSSPIAVWHKADLRAYRLMAGVRRPVPLNPVAIRLGMSGECGCLANAVAGEVERWRAEYPDEPFIVRVIEVEDILAGPGYEFIPAHRKRWGWGAEYAEPDAAIPFGSDSLCGTNCGVDLADLMDPMFEMEAESA